MEIIKQKLKRFKRKNIMKKIIQDSIINELGINNKLSKTFIFIRD